MTKSPRVRYIPIVPIPVFHSPLMPLMQISTPTRPRPVPTVSHKSRASVAPPDPLITSDTHSHNTSPPPLPSIDGKSRQHLSPYDELNPHIKCGSANTDEPTVEHQEGEPDNEGEQSGSEGEVPVQMSDPKPPLATNPWLQVHILHTVHVISDSPISSTECHLDPLQGTLP